jgi:O-acetylserine/cysteine efflux transporter
VKRPYDETIFRPLAEVSNQGKFHSNDADNRVVMLKLRRHSALLALLAAGLLWGLTVPLSKLVLEWLDGGTLTVVRFALAAPLLAFAARKHLRAAFTPRILFAGAIGYGVVIVLQNLGIGHTSVSHASLIVGATPALVALVAVAGGRGSCGPAAWLGFALALGGVAIVAGGGGGGASLSGDALVLLSVAISATFVVVQPSLLAGRDPFAVTAVQMIGGGLAAIPNAALEGLPHAPASAAPVLALLALVIAGTVGPFALFAYGQSRVAPELAGTFLNLEPLVGTAAGALAFGDPFGPAQLLGGAVILAGIALSTTPRKGAGGGGRTPAGAFRTARRRSAPSHRRRGGGSLPSCPQASTRSTSPTPPRPTASARAAEMTVLAARPARTAAPRAFSVPVVREIASWQILGAAYRT